MNGPLSCFISELYHFIAFDRIAGNRGCRKISVEVACAYQHWNASVCGDRCCMRVEPASERIPDWSRYWQLLLWNGRYRDTIVASCCPSDRFWACEFWLCWRCEKGDACAWCLPMPCSMPSFSRKAKFYCWLWQLQSWYLPMDYLATLILSHLSTAASMITANGSSKLYAQNSVSVFAIKALPLFTAVPSMMVI